MVRMLKSKGYKQTTNDPANNREFRQVAESYTINEDYSTFGKQMYDLEEETELFLDTRNYSEQKLKAILDETRSNLVDEISADIEKQERGYLITFITMKEGVEWLQT